MKTIFTFLFGFLSCAVTAQTTIYGTVRDGSGAAVSGANVILVDTYDGATTDSKGKYEFVTSETGKRVVVFRFVGLNEVSREVLLEGNAIVIDVSMEEAVSELESVTITAGSFTASDVSRRTVFKALDIATTAGATADIAGALNTLPGTQKVGETGRLFVRGGDGSETRTFIDGMMVLDAYGVAAPNTPSRGRFLPFMFKGTSFSTGGYSAEYGQALSSALVLDSKDEDLTTRTDLGILSVGADVAHTQSWNGGSAAGKIQYTNIRPYYGLINQEVDWKTAPASLETVGAFRQRVGKSGMVKLYGNMMSTSFSLYNHDIDDPSVKTLYDLTNRYRYMNAAYKTALSNDWSVRGGVSYNFIQNEVEVAGINVNETEKGFHVKNVFEGSLNQSLEVKTGVELIRRDYSRLFTSGIPDDKFTEDVVAGFLETDMYAGNNFVTRAGGRVEYNSLTGSLIIDPRISMAYKTGASSQISLATGQFRQTAKIEYVRINHDLRPEKAQHYILNYQRIENNKTFRVETFYKRYDDLIKFGNADGTVLNNEGDGYSKGIEVFWRDNKSVSPLDYWVSYSYLDTKREYLNYPKEATPYFASQHNFSIVGKYFVSRIKSQIGATYSYTSGRPFNNPNSDKFNDSKTPAYSDLSLNWSYLPTPSVIIFLSCTNLLGRDNVFGYEYSSVENAEGTYNRRAIRQAAPRFMFIGIFITFSKDKSINQLPSL